MGFWRENSRLVQDKERTTARYSRAYPRRGADRVNQAQCPWLVFSISQGPLPPCESWNSVQFHVAAARSGSHSCGHQPRSTTNLEDACRNGRCIKGDPRPDPEPCLARRQLEELRPLDLHAGEAGWHGKVGQIRTAAPDEKEGA